MTRLTSIAAAIVMVVASLGIFASPGAAHERRTVGPYTFVVGWMVEPAIAGQTNGLDVTVTETAGGKPVEGLATTLKAEVVIGGGAARRTLDLAEDRDQPGHYTSAFVPTRIGEYTFHLSGTAGTTKIDEKFESGPGRFDPVTDISALEFPDHTPSAASLASQLVDANTKLTIAMVLGAAALVLSVASLAMSRRR